MPQSQLQQIRERRATELEEEAFRAFFMKRRDYASLDTLPMVLEKGEGPSCEELMYWREWLSANPHRTSRWPFGLKLALIWLGCLAWSVTAWSIAIWTIMAIVR